MSKKSIVGNPATAAVRLVTAAAFALTTVSAFVYTVAPNGEPQSLASALDKASAGDTIILSDGIYNEPIVTMNPGTEGSPILIVGGKGAVINDFTGDRSLPWSQKVVDIRHPWITLRVRSPIAHACRRR